MAHVTDSYQGEGHSLHALEPSGDVAGDRGRQSPRPDKPKARLLTRTDFHRAPGANNGASHPVWAMHEPIHHFEAQTLPGLHSDALDRRDRAASAAILIIDDSTLQRENLAAILADNGMSAPSMAWNLPSMVSALAQRAPDIVLLSMATRENIAYLHSIRDACPAAKVIVIGIAEDDERNIITAAEAGVAGYHLRTESLRQLLEVITKVIHGESACSPKVSAILLQHLSAMASQRRSEPKELVLTGREIQILEMLEMGLSNREIADRLCIALHTVKNHVHSVLSKLGVRGRAEAAAVSRSLH